MVKTNPRNVEEANRALFRATMNLPAAAEHCGMTKREMKMAFREYLKYHPMTHQTSAQLELDLISASK